MRKNSFAGFGMVAALALAALSAGCASVAVTSESIEQKTAFALQLDKSAFTISDRVDNGVQTNYNVKTNDGRTFSCYVTGTVGYMGRVVSDAVCSETTKPVAQAPAAAPTPAATATPAKASTKASTKCNALLKSAGKC